MLQPNFITHNEIASTLRRIAKRLEGLGRGSTLSPNDRRLCQHYAPFVLQMAKRQHFCEEMAALKIDPNLSLKEALAGTLPILRKYRFPTASPFELRGWAELLFLAQMGSEDFLPFSLGSFGDATLEVELIYRGSRAQEAKVASQLPITKAIPLTLPPGLSENQTKLRLITACRGRLYLFLDTIRRLRADGSEFDFEVRLMRLEPNWEALADHPFISEVMQTFNIYVPRGRRRDRLLSEIASRLVDILARVSEYPSAAGRTPDSQSAIWWAKRELDGLSVRDIARQETRDIADAMNRRPTIDKALERLGLTTK